jgi:predicted enzyme related to lactoylglutathione lyase/quinol monooxygenase YgiN
MDKFQSSFHVLVKFTPQPAVKDKLGALLRENASGFADQPGFVSQEVFSMPDGSYTCLLRWKTEADHVACMNADHSGKSCMQINELVESGKVKMEIIHTSLVAASEDAISKGNAVKNMLSWFEIPSKDFERARTFYSQILDAKLEAMGHSGVQMAFLPREGGGVSGAVAAGGERTPGQQGPWIFLNANPDLETILSRVQRAGGKITQPKTDIGEYGHIAFFEDTEGNRIGLHSGA